MRQAIESHKGFSLIELLIVVSLSTLLTALFAINISFFDRLLVSFEAEKLYLTCRHLQQEAMSCNRSITLTFDATKQSYQFHGDSTKLGRNVSFGFLPGSKGPPSSPHHLIVKPITFVNNRIEFNPDGIIQSGSVYLISKDKQIMYALCCPVSSVSYIRLYRYDGNWHLIS